MTLYFENVLDTHTYRRRPGPIPAIAALLRYAENMAETTIPNTGDPRVDAALERIRGKFSDLEDAMVVQAYLEKGLASRVKEHAEFIVSQEAAWRKHTQAMGEIDDKLNALIDVVSRMQGGMESRPS